jgi:Ubiquitin-protein ligase
MQKANKRIQKEYEELTKTPPDGVVVTSENMFDSWDVLLQGPQGTPYEGGTFLVKMKFPDNYPFKPPKATFATKIYHPSIKKDTGEICKDIYEEGWVPTKTIKQVIDVLKSMLMAPNTDTPLETDIAQEYLKDRAKFDATAKEWVNKYAKN